MAEPQGSITGYVAPSGIITLYSGVPLNPNHSDVILIHTNQEAFNALQAFAPVEFSDQSYIRQERDKLRIQAKASRIMTCNYISWYNQHGMYMFAFVTNVGYINENCTEITYVIDNYMTWFPFLRLGECFVEREIPRDDTIYSNLIPENLELGEYVENYPNFPTEEFDLGKTHLLLIASTDENGERPEIPQSATIMPTECFMNGVASCLIKKIVPCDNKILVLELLDEINTYIENGYGENIVALWLVPYFVIKNIDSTTWDESRYAIDDWQISTPNTLNGYTPKNKKLLSSPYQKLILTNLSGQNAEYHYEDFINPDNITFKVVGCCYGLPSVMVEPRDYKYHRGSNPDYGLLLTNFPQAPTLNDTYKAYLAQNKASITTSILASITSMGIGVGLMASGVGTIPAIAMFASGAAGVSSAVAKVSDSKASPTTVSGLIQNDSLNLVRDLIKLEAKHISIKREMAEKIDEYFSAYGYACHSVKVPDIEARSNWSYVKTNGCILLGSAPYQAKNDIIQNFDNGIRVWRNIMNIGTFGDNN